MIPTWAIILDYVLGTIMWTLIGRAFMNIFQREDSTFFFMRVFVKYTNPIINLYRRITPKARSHDEHPLIKKDFEILKKNFNNLNIKYYGFLTLLLFLLYKEPSKSKVFKFLSLVDQNLFKLKVFQKLAWSVVISAKKN